MEELNKIIEKSETAESLISNLNAWLEKAKQAYEDAD